MRMKSLATLWLQTLRCTKQFSTSAITRICAWTLLTAPWTSPSTASSTWWSRSEIRRRLQLLNTLFIIQVPQSESVTCDYEAEGITNYHQCNTIVGSIILRNVLMTLFPDSRRVCLRAKRFNIFHFLAAGAYFDTVVCIYLRNNTCNILNSEMVKVVELNWCPVASVFCNHIQAIATTPQPCSLKFYCLLLATWFRDLEGICKYFYYWKTLLTPRIQVPLWNGMRVNARKLNAKQDTKLIKLSYEELIVTKVGITAVWAKRLKWIRAVFIFEEESSSCFFPLLVPPFRDGIALWQQC